MAFGISFGANKQKGSSSTTVNKTETTNQQQTGTQTQTGTTTNTGTSATSSSQVGSTSQQSQTAGTGSSTTQQSQTQFSQPIISTLEAAVQKLFGNAPTTPMSMQDSFNADQFVSGGVEAAQSAVNSELESSLNSMFDQFGGRDDQNSMAALLANRARGDAAAQVAGVRSNLTGQAQQIERERFLANLQGVGQQQGFLASVLEALKGGVATGTAATQTAEQQTGSQTGQTAQSGTSNTATSNTEVQNIVTALTQLLSGTTNTVGTENTRQKGTSMGGGLGLSI